MHVKPFHFLGWMTLAAAMLHGQTVPPTTGAQFWSTDPNLDCSGSGTSPGTNYSIQLPSGATGYVCEVSGNFIWLAAGAGYTTSIRVPAPEPATAGQPSAVGVDYSFYDTSGNKLSLDNTSPNGAASGNDVNFVLKANQPAEVNLLGAPGNGPSYPTLVDGSVFAVFYCPDYNTCQNVAPQLIYSAPPTISLSVPLSWDGQQWTQWSATGIDDGGAHRMSLVVFNLPGPSAQSTNATIYTVRVYNSAGTLVGTGTTPAIAEYGTYGVLLSDIVKSKLPSGIFKIHIDGGTLYSQAIVIQANGNALTTVQVGYDSAPAAGSAAMTSTPMSLKRARAPAKTRQQSGTLAK